jgi:hypothetical protein
MSDFAPQFPKPNEFLTVEEKIRQFGSIDNFEIAALKYILQFYNRNLFNITRVNSQQQNRSNYSALTDIGRMEENMQFAQGIQFSTDYRYLRMDYNNNMLPLPHIPGQDTRTLYMFLHGNMVKMASAAKVTVRVNSPSINTKINKKLMAFNFMKAMPQIMQDLSQSGIEVVPNAEELTGIVEPADEAIEKVLYETYAGKLHKIAQSLIDNICEKSDFTEQTTRFFLNAIILKDGYYVVTEDGLIEATDARFHGNLWAAGKDSDTGRNDMARFMIEYISKEDVLTTYGNGNGLTEAQEKEIKENTASASTFVYGLNNGINFPFIWGDGQMYTRITCYRQSVVDTRHKIDKDDEGQKILKYAGAKNSKNKRYIPCLRKTVLIGDKYVVERGVHETMYDYSNPKKKQYPIFRYSALTMGGINVSIVESLKNTQKNIDAIRDTLLHKMGIDLSDFVVFDGAAFKGRDVADVISDIKQFGATISTPDEDEENIPNKRPLMQKESASLSNSLNTYIGLLNTFRKELMDIINTSQMVMGTPTAYVSQNTQQQSMAASSNNVAMYYHYTMQSMANALQYALNVRIKKIRKNATFEDEQIIGLDGIEFIKNMPKDILAEHLQIFVKVDDIIDNTKRAKLEEVALVLANAGALKPEDMVKIQTSRTFTELLEYLEKRTNLEEDKRRKEALANLMAQSNMAKESNATKLQSKAMEVDGGIAKEQIAASGQMLNTAIKNDVPIDQEMMPMQ